MTDIGRLYSERFPEADQAGRQRIWEALCDSFFDAFIAPDATVLDIACGYGEFINAVRCGRRIAIDINPDARRHLRPDVTFLHQSSTNLAGIASDSIDVAFESNFFEHLASKDEVRTVVDEVRRTLRPGGRFIMLQPNIRYVGGAYWDFWDHHIAMTERSLAELLVNCGMRIHTVIPRFLPYTTRSRLPQHPALVRAYLKLPPLWKILGKQFLIVAEK
jgi:SAM-dependent methyltransferase